MINLPDKLFINKRPWLDICIYIYVKRNIKDGELLVSLKDIADEFNTTKGKVRHIMDKFYNEKLLFRTILARLPHGISSDSQGVTSNSRTTSARLPHGLAPIEERKKAFAERLRPYVSQYGGGMLNDFYEYWTERNDGGWKMRFEMQPVFETAKRLVTWDLHPIRVKYDKRKKNTNEQQSAQRIANAEQLINDLLAEQPQQQKELPQQQELNFLP